MLRGWAFAEQEQSEVGMAQMRQGLAAAESIGIAWARPYFLGLLAEAHGRIGQVEEGLTLLAESLSLVEATQDHFWEAELYRLRGELLRRQATNNSGLSTALSEAETCFRQALELARCQQAKSWELRAATSLSGLWQQQGRQAEVHQLLAPVYGWFSEGFDTPDLQAAQALLDALPEHQ
jgi:predicted ATPase